MKSGPKILEPGKYSRTEDAEVFEDWLNTILRWLRINKMCGPDADEDQLVCTPLFLEGQAQTWWTDHVDGIYHAKKVWSFKEGICSLYNHFIYDTAMHDTAEKFNRVKYDANKGIMAYYYELE